MSNAEDVSRIAENFHMKSKGANEGASVVSLSEKVPFVRSLRQTPAKLETNRVRSFCVWEPATRQSLLQKTILRRVTADLDDTKSHWKFVVKSMAC